MRIGEHLGGPTLAPLDDPTTTLGFGDDPSLLATLAPERAVPRLGTRGWAVYGAPDVHATADADLDRRRRSYPLLSMIVFRSAARTRVLATNDNVR
jgi:hypothetical protein